MTMSRVRVLLILANEFNPSTLTPDTRCSFPRVYASSQNTKLDQLRRANDPPSVCIVPSIKEYRDHMVSEDLIPREESGGLYRGAFLKDFLHDGHTPRVSPIPYSPWNRRRLYFDDKSW